MSNWHEQMEIEIAALTLRAVQLDMLHRLERDAAKASMVTDVELDIITLQAQAAQLELLHQRQREELRRQHAEYMAWWEEHLERGPSTK